MIDGVATATFTLPGLTPDYSDLCLIANRARIDYRTLIGEILSGAIKRWQTFSGKDAICAETGLSFDEIASTRGVASASGSAPAHPRTSVPE